MNKLALAILFACAAHAQSGAGHNWNRQGAAAYLDQRMDWWAAWPTAARDRETYCVSCHTSLPYALARPALRSALGQPDLSATERRFVENTSKRVAEWNDVQPFYKDTPADTQRAARSRATEAVLNALILARYNAPGAADALRDMWALEIKSGEQRGSWAWMNFHNEPWEAEDSGFWGASLAALAAGFAPPESRADGSVHENLALLAGYLQREEAAQSTLNRAVALWASGLLPDLLNHEQQTAIAQDIIAKQRGDGGWCSAALLSPGWKRRDDTPLNAESDGYGTGLMVVALRESGLPSAQAAIAKGQAWLRRNQLPAGTWLATSMNKQRDPASDIGRFMDDAATAYSALALSSR